MYRITSMLLLVSVVFACQSRYHEEWLDEGGFRYYEIDRDVILQRLVEGDKEVFGELEEAPSDDERYTRVSVPWKLNEYLLIAEAIYNLNWNEPTADWRISALDFSMDCPNVSIGYESARVEYSKIFQGPSGENREVRAIQVLPRENLITVHEETYIVISPGEWPYIDLQKIPFSPLDALQMAEQVGGAEFRKIQNNLCKILVFYNDYQKWEIGYFTNGGAFFGVQVDPFTGDHEIIKE